MYSPEHLRKNNSLSTILTQQNLNAYTSYICIYTYILMIMNYESKLNFGSNQKAQNELNL